VCEKALKKERKKERKVGLGSGDDEEKERRHSTSYSCDWRGGKKSLRHPVFPGGHPSKY
jgi:hypothetical protein